LAIPQQCGGVRRAATIIGHDTPSAGGRIVQFRSAEKARAATPSDQYAAVRQQCRRMAGPRIVEIAGDGPSAGSWIVEFGAREFDETGAYSCCDEHPAIGEQGRRVKPPGTMEAAGDGPVAGGGIVQFRARENAAAVGTPCDKDLAAGKQRRRVAGATSIEATGVLPLAGSGSAAEERIRSLSAVLVWIASVQWWIDRSRRRSERKPSEGEGQ
jgi:hypothetical protein